MQIRPLKHKIRSFLEYLQYHTNLDMLYLARGSFWSGLGFSASSILSAIIVFIFANFVPKETYGIYRYILSLAGSLGFLTLTGMNIAVTQAVASGYDGALKQAIKIQLRWNGLFFLASIGLGLYYLLHGNYTIAISLIMIGLGFPLNATYNTYGAFLGGKKDFKRVSLYSTLSTIAYIILMTATIIITHNVIILTTVYAFSNLLPTIYFYKRTLQIYRPQGNSTHDAKELEHYGKHLSVY